MAELPSTGGARAKSPQHRANGARDDDVDQRLDDLERRFASGEVPDDFLRVTEPKEDGGPGPGANGPEPPVANLLDLPGDGPPVPAGVASPEREQARPTAGAETGASPESAERHSAQSPMSSEEQDRALALALQEQLNMESEEAAQAAAAAASGGFQYAAGGAATVAAPDSMVGRLTVTVVEARLAKNYGFSRMDPYCRVRVGHSVYETPTCANGSKEPKWNKTFHCYLLQGVRQMGVEVYDECTFSTDPLIAHGVFELPESLLAGREVVDIWFPLSGQEGAEKEGMLHVILSLQRIAPGQPLAVAPQLRAARNVGAGGKPMYYTTAPQQQQGQQQPPPQPARPKLSEEELEEFVKMFPNLDKEIILSVFSASNGNKEAMVNNLLELGTQ